MKSFIKLVIPLIIGTGIFFYFLQDNDKSEKVESITKTFNTDDILKKAYDNHYKSYQVKGAGKVIKILLDDNKGSRHQRFIIRLQSGQTLLIAHNIDIAPRVPNLKIGENIEFYGEYEYNSKGGVIHWTHHAPKGRHVTGWLQYKGKVYK